MSNSCLLLIVLAGMPVRPLVADEASVLIDEHFDAEEIPKLWQPGGRKGSFTIVHKTLRGVAQPDDSHGPSIGVPIIGDDLDIEFDVKFAKPHGYFLFLIDGESQFSGKAHLLRFAATPKHIQLMQDRGDPASKIAQKKERDARGGKRIPPSLEQLADPSFYRIEQLDRQDATPNDGEWHHVQIKLRSNNVTAQFDRQPVIQTTATVLNVPKSRIVFLVGQKGDVRIDNVKVVNHKTSN